MPGTSPLNRSSIQPSADGETTLENLAGVLAELERTDVAGAEVRAAFEADKIASVLLRGRAFARRLYDQVWERPYADTDLIVARDHVPAAEAILIGLGYRRIDSDGDRAEGPGYSHSWLRASHELIELNWSLSGATAEPAVVWEALSSHTIEQPIGGRHTRVPDDVLTVVVVVLHAAHQEGHHGSTTPDLDRVTTRVALEAWCDAVRLAERIGAREAFAAGLELSAASRALATRLGFTETASLEYRLRANEAKFWVWSLDRLIGARGWSWVRIVADVIAPPPELMRRINPLARRGKRGMIAAYLIRPTRLISHLAPALRDYARARRES